MKPELDFVMHVTEKQQCEHPAASVWREMQRDGIHEKDTLLYLKTQIKQLFFKSHFIYKDLFGSLDPYYSHFHIVWL